jgi:transposase
MDKQTIAGVDVSASRLDVAAQRGEEHLVRREFANTAKGHQRVIRWLTKRGAHARVVLEATGVYSQDLALALAEAAGVEVMVANPRATHAFATACMQRTRTDLTMAIVLQEYAARMRFVPWVVPSPAARALQAVGRRMATLSAEQTREKNRLHAVRAKSTTPRAIVNDVKAHLRHLTRRQRALSTEAQRLIANDPQLTRAAAQLTSIPGVALTSAIYLLGELLTLPPDMNVRQWVAHAGLDVRLVQSGTSVRPVPRMSKMGNAHLRRALYMPALVAIRFQPNVRAFYEELLARSKAPLQAVIAVMRKLLHAIYGMFKTNTDFDGAKFRTLAAASPP